MLFIKGIYLLLSHLPTSPAIGGCLTPSSTIIIRLRIHIVRHPSICASEMRSCADRASGHAFS